MMQLFDYIFYRVSSYYQRREDDGFVIYGIGAVTILQINYLILILLLFAFSSKDINHIVFEEGEGKNFLTSGIIFPTLTIYGLNLIRYLRFVKYDELNKKWLSEDKYEKRIRKRQIIVLYIMSIVITVCLSIYRKYYW